MRLSTFSLALSAALALTACSSGSAPAAPTAPATAASPVTAAAPATPAPVLIEPGLPPLAATAAEDLFLRAIMPQLHARGQHYQAVAAAAPPPPAETDPAPAPPYIARPSSPVAASADDPLELGVLLIALSTEEALQHETVNRRRGAAIPEKSDSRAVR